MFTFFKDSSGCRIVFAAASITAVGNIIWLVAAANAVGWNNSAVNDCFQYYNITDANLITTEECMPSYNPGQTVRDCRMVGISVYDRYTTEHCGEQLRQLYAADYSLLFSRVVLILNVGLAVAYGCFYANNASETAAPLTGIRPEVAAQHDGGSPLFDANGSNNYSTFSVDEVSTVQQSGVHGCSLSSANPA